MKPVTKEKIGWGFVGTGRIAKDFAECIALLDDCYVAAVGSRRLRAQNVLPTSMVENRMAVMRK